MPSYKTVKDKQHAEKEGNEQTIIPIILLEKA